jgi:hypothetical protein
VVCCVVDVVVVVCDDCVGAVVCVGCGDDVVCVDVGCVVTGCVDCTGVGVCPLVVGVDGTAGAELTEVVGAGVTDGFCTTGGNELPPVATGSALA